MPDKPEWIDRISVSLRDWLLYALASLGAFLHGLFRPPARILSDIGVSGGQHVLELACGPGGTSLTAACMVGTRGRVYAVNTSRLALAGVMRGAHRRRLANIVPLPVEGVGGIPPDSVDIALVFDALHAIPEPREIVQELHRIISPEGFVCVRDTRLGNIRIVALMTAGGLFELFHLSFGQDCGHGFKKAQRVSLE